MCDDLDVINFLLLLHHHLCVWPPCGGFTPLFFSCYCLYSTVSLAAFFFFSLFHFPSIIQFTTRPYKNKKKKRCLFPPLLCVCNLSSRLKKNSKKKKRQQQHNHHRVAYLIIVLLTPSRHDLLLLFLSSLKLKKVDFLFLSFSFC